MPKPPLLTIIVFAFVLFFSGCAGKTGSYLPVFSTQPRVSTLGFSVRPPQGLNWFEKVDRNSITYYKKTPHETYAIISLAIELRFDHRFESADEFFSFAQTRKQLAGNTSQIRNVEVSFGTPVQNGSCLRYHQSYHDYRPNTLPSQPQETFAHVDNIGIICLHPDNPSVGIDLYYQERSAPGDLTISFAEEGESFLSSLSFLTMQAKR